MYRESLWILAGAVAANLAVFAVYRAVFLRRFARPAARAHTARVLLSGARLDAAWLGFVLALSGLVLALAGGHTSRTLFLVAWYATGLHLFVCFSNLCTFAERGQGAGELLLPYLASPYQAFLATAPFLVRQWPLMVGLVLAGAAFVGAGPWLGRSFAGEPGTQWGTARGVAAGLAAIGLPILPMLHVVTRRKVGRTGKRRGGWRFTITKAKYYMVFPDYVSNQAVMNPLLEFVFQQVPAHLRSTIRYRLSETEALEVWRSVSGQAPADPEFPLLRTVCGTAGSPIENLLVLQVEGFSQSVLEQRRGGREVMPFVSQLARAGRYFPNTFQCANFTSGGVFATLASMPRAAYDEPGARFTSYELNGYYGSPPRVFGLDDYTHFFLFGFRQSCGDFMAFAANQGCQVTGYFEFADLFRRRKQLAEVDTLLGIFDGYFLDECARRLLECPTRFTAHLVTASTHSPWATPASFPTQFEEPELNAFAYLDASIRRFHEQLRAKPGLWEKTLFVILGDHTSVTFGDTWLERFRIPLIFHHPGLPSEPGPCTRRAGQLDVLPTALSLFPGNHRYAGMGRNLFDPAAPEVGFVTGTAREGYFLRDDFVLTHDPLEREVRLFDLVDGRLSGRESSASHSETHDRVRREYFAAVELAKRLSLGKRIFPMAVGR